MRLRIFSDLHLEFGTIDLQPGDEDVVVAAGDVHLGTRGVEWLGATFPGTPVVYVAGNHEFYKHAAPKLVAALREAAAASDNVRFLENEAIEIDGVRFLGTTLWTDWRLNGDARLNGAAAHSVMQDFRRIRVSPTYRKLRPEDTGGLHVRARTWLQSALAEGGPCVVVTHHAPSARSLDPLDLSDPVSAAYASNLDGLVEDSGAQLWVHGHTHIVADYMVGRTRVLSNPRGYADEPVEGFEPNLVVDLCTSESGGALKA